MKFVLPAGKPEPEPEPRRHRPSWFWWTLINVTAACFAILAWVGCLFVFTHPEKPENYRWLKKIGRTPQLHPYTALDAPAGTEAGPRSLYRKFLPLSTREITMLNPRLLRVGLLFFRRQRRLPAPTFEVRTNVPEVEVADDTDTEFPGLVEKVVNDRGLADRHIALAIVLHPPYTPALAELLVLGDANAVQPLELLEGIRPDSQPVPDAGKPPARCVSGHIHRSPNHGGRMLVVPRLNPAVRVDEIGRQAVMPHRQ